MKIKRCNIEWSFLTSLVSRIIISDLRDEAFRSAKLGARYVQAAENSVLHKKYNIDYFCTVLDEPQ